MQIQTGQFRTPPVVLNLAIINILVYLAEVAFPGGYDYIIGKFALFYPESPLFRIYQFLTYMFLHANFSHVFFNMFALWMFGRSLEYAMGSKRFLLYYLLCGVGAALFFLLVTWIELSYINPGAYFDILRTPMLGASGAVFGILLAYGMMFPNSVIMLIFPPIAMKAKYFVMIYGAVELLFGVAGTNDGVAHFAHVGGMLWGFILLWWWKKRGKIHY